MFREPQAEEAGHHNRLIERHRQRFGEHIPLIRRQDVRGFVDCRPVWLIRPLGLAVVRRQAETMELETRRFYERASQQVTDASTRKLLDELAETEREHTARAAALEERYLPPDVRTQMDTPFLSAAFQVVVGGVLVFLAGILIGSS